VGVGRFACAQVVKVQGALSELQILQLTDSTARIVLQNQTYTLDTDVRVRHGAPISLCLSMRTQRAVCGAPRAQGAAIDAFMRQLVTDLQAVSRQGIATMTHDVSDWNLLPFKRGDIITLKERDPESGWFRGEIQDRAGW
jgi:hypothetical protein